MCFSDRQGFISASFAQVWSVHAIWYSPRHRQLRGYCRPWHTKESFTLEFDTGSGITWTQCQPCSGPAIRRRNKCSIQPSQPRTIMFRVSQHHATCSLPVKGVALLKLDMPLPISRLLGLSPSSESLPSQTAEKYQRQFSYCLPSSPSSTGYLNFGGKVSQTAGFTPLSPDFSFYYGIDIVGISVGGSQLPIDPSIFTTSGAIIDSVRSSRGCLRQHTRHSRKHSTGKCRIIPRQTGMNCLTHAMILVIIQQFHFLMSVCPSKVGLKWILMHRDPVPGGRCQDANEMTVNLGFSETISKRPTRLSMMVLTECLVLHLVVAAKTRKY
ncbi:hypothetical protein NC651_017006 [Populus alba x Populus x berolinensis]|nr:hypothetical protein NC651_017006 [Populus alba x Populus x berolinensis]